MNTNLIFKFSYDIRKHNFHASAISCSDWKKKTFIKIIIFFLFSQKMGVGRVIRHGTRERKSITAPPAGFYESVFHLQIINGFRKCTNVAWKLEIEILCRELNWNKSTLQSNKIKYVFGVPCDTPCWYSQTEI